MADGSILFFDLARQMGWAEGAPGAKAISGTHKLAPDGSEPMAVFGGMIQFLGTRLSAFRPRMIVYEAPMDPRHLKTNINTARMLLGLPAIVEGVAYRFGVYNVREVSVHDVRKFLLGHRPKKGDGKHEVTDHLRALGYEPKDDNEADAIAGWLYSCSIIDSRVGSKSTRMFAEQ